MATGGCDFQRPLGAFLTLDVRQIGQIGRLADFTQILTDQLRRAHPTQAPTPAGSGAADVVRSLIVAPTDYGLLCLVFVTLGWADVFAVLYGLLFLGTTLFVLAALPKWYREVSRFRPAPKPGAAA